MFTDPKDSSKDNSTSQKNSRSAPQTSVHQNKKKSLNLKKVADNQKKFSITG